MRLVILSACETSRGAEAYEFSSIAETLIRQGIPAVVANQLPVPNKSVAVFVAALYRELLDSSDIDFAVTEGRVALAANLQGGPEWGIPTLHRLSGASRLFI